MSAKATNWAWQQTGLNPQQKLVLLALADFHSDSQGCFPSIPAICKKTGLSRSTVLRALMGMQNLGLIERAERFGGKSNQISNNYVLVGVTQTPSPSVAQTPPPSITETPLPPVSHRHGGSVPQTPKHKNNNNTDTSYLSDPLLDFVNTVAPEPQILEEPPFDPVKFFWDEALRKLRNMAVPEHKSRVMIGKWLKQTGDDRDAVMAAIDKAVEIGTMEPVSFIVKSLDKKSFTPHKEQTRREMADVIERFRAKGAERRAQWEADAGGSGVGDTGGISVGDDPTSSVGEIHDVGGKRARKVQTRNARKTGKSLNGSDVEKSVPSVDSGIDF